MAKLENNGSSSLRNTCSVHYHESYHSVMVDFHVHEYYEINLIISGDVTSLLSDRSIDGTQSRLVLSAPNNPHFIRLSSPSLYSRIVFFFSPDFVTDYVPEWRTLKKAFGKNGNIIMLSEEQCDFCKEKLLSLKDETNTFRQKLRTLEFLSYIYEFDDQSSNSVTAQPPSYIVEALTYIDDHYHESIVANELALRLGICRTTLFTSFKKHTGTTLSEYIMRVRVKKAINLIMQGIRQELVAEKVGFGNSGSLIRAFHHCYGMTPKQYCKQHTKDV